MYSPVTHRQALRRGVSKCTYSTFHSDPGTTPRAHPRIDSLTLTEWIGLDRDIEQHLDMPELDSRFQADENSMHNPSRKVLSEEEDIRAYTEKTCFRIVEESLQDMGINAEVRRRSGTSTVGDPDFLVVTWDNARPKPRMMIEVKCPWSALTERTTIQHLQNILIHYDNDESDKLSSKEKGLLHTLQQAAGYMALNYLRYGVITTHDVTFALCRTGEAGEMLISRPILAVDAERPNYTELLHYLTYKCCTGSDWFYSSPFNTPESKRRLIPPKSSPAMEFPADEPHQLMEMPHTNFYRHFKLNAIRYQSEHSTLWETSLQKTGKMVAIKMVDNKHKEYTEQLSNEVNIYKSLVQLQGTVIPTILGYIRLWDLFDILVLNELGQRIDEWNMELKDQAKQVLTKVHALNCLHGDIKADNFVLIEGRMTLIDFGLASKSDNPKAIIQEMRTIDGF